MSDSKPWEQTWHVDIYEHETLGAQCEGINDETHRSVVVTDNGVYPPSIAQAHLIAAAPELYRELAEAACLLDSAAANAANQTKAIPEDPLAYAVLTLARDRALAVLRKARGET